MVDLKSIGAETAAILGLRKETSARDQEFEDAVFKKPSAPKVDIASDEIRKRAIEYNMQMNSRASIRGEIAGYLRWGAIAVFSALLGAGVTGNLPGLISAVFSIGGLGLVGGAVALAGAAIYLGVRNSKIQSEKNMNIGDYEMRRSAKFFAKELGQVIKPETGESPILSQPVTSTSTALNTATPATAEQPARTDGKLWAQVAAETQATEAVRSI